MPVIATHDLRKHYGEVKAVDGIDLSISEGEIFGLLGPNGAGKTTTLHMLATLQRPTSGSAVVAGFDTVKQPLKVRQRVGMVFQEPTLDSTLTGRENLDLHGRLYGVKGKERPGRIAELLKLVDLEGRADDFVKHYSGGMKRRLEIARGIMHHPEILFLDEPTLGLDPQTREHIWAYIEKMVAEQHTTIILTTHYMDEADRLCDRIGIIDHGKIIALDTPENLCASLGGDVVKLRMANPTTKPFEAMKFVKAAEIKGNEVLLTVEDSSSHLAEILQRSDGVQHVELHTPTLNDVFLKFTGREMREESGEGGFLADYQASQRGH
ncbi:MAG: ATP-binding cassette domain-containing protein [Halobacteriales archaeon]|nr:ATP-binding cassette domain-containing protein [Halobacteriales archaeon]